MAEICTRRYFPSALLLFVLMSLLALSCHSEEIFLPCSSTSVAESPVLELNRERREVFRRYESLRNVKVFDLGAVFRDANATFKNENRKFLTRPKGENIQKKITVIPAPALPVPSPCRDLQTDLGRSVAGFTQCAVMNARPITVCRQCVAAFNDTVNTYQKLTDTSENATQCKDLLFGKDKLEIAETMYENVVNLWNQANCYSCYEEKSGSPDLTTVSNETLAFFQVLSRVTECFERIKILREINGTSNNTCSECRELYEHLGAVYEGIVQDLFSNQLTEVCADIADAMNVTHHLWNNQFKCKLFGKDVGYAIIVLTGSLSAVPVLFYLAAKILSNAETILLVLPKRKSFVQGSARLQM